ncbi:MAG: ABC transporter permease [Gammaproteobacteria bacterium WSBS_2016_MAG_OTU1]
MRNTLVTFGRLRESIVGSVGFAIVVFWVLVAIFADVIAPFDPLQQIAPLAKPGAVSEGGGILYLGADFLGRDILSRIIHGTRTIMLWAPLATAAALISGIVLGLTGGYYGGRIDDIISFIANMILAYPVLVLLILLIGILGQSGLSIVIAITFASAPAVFRIVRGEVLTIRNRDFIAAAKTRGENVPYILMFEILPNAKAPLIVDACLRMGYTTILIGILGFLGLGLPPPTPDWGGMVNENRALALAFPHMTVFPCLAISSLVLGLNLLADGISEINKKV